MRRIATAILMTALMGASPVWAQSEMEMYQQTGDGLLAAHREATQRNIDLATKQWRVTLGGDLLLKLLQLGMARMLIGIAHG